MKENGNGKHFFIEQMNSGVFQCQNNAVQKQENNLPKLDIRQQQSAQRNLLQLDHDLESSKISEEDRFIGRWSHYRVSNNMEQRLSLNRPFKKLSTNDMQEFNDFQQEACHNGSKTIPKLKNILHQLDNPPFIAKIPGKTLYQSKKMKNHIGIKALVISNKEQIRSQKKFSSTLYGLIKGVQNRKPQSNYSSSKVQSCGGSYQKINRQTRFNHNQDKELQYQEVLTQLIKQKYAKNIGQNVPLSNMINYITTGDKKKKASYNKLGLNQLLL